MRYLVYLLIAIALVALGATWQRAVTPPVTLCQTEDSINCFWDAQKLGNSSGISFMDVDGHPYYQPEDLAR